ncbi:MAG TPA: class F sortase [Propionibacteriaceae bacterium]|nr:class F sortase [Propionibacteriaceae bacterium]
MFGQQGGRRWLTALLVSCLVLMVAGWRLAIPTDSGGGQILPVSASAPTREAHGRSPIAPPAEPDAAISRGSERLSGSPTRAATQSRADEPGPPRMLAIPRLDLKMPITAVTVDDTGAMAVPTRPSEIGWYAYGPRPGSARGSAVLGGHVDSREYGVGPLVALKQLRRGDDIVITTNRGTERFRVSTIRLIGKRDLDLRDVFTREGKPLLRILTCGGTYRRSGGYQANVVVTARPV